MDLTALMVAVLTALVALVGGYLSGRRESGLEFEKWLRTREDDLAKEARLAVAELVHKLASATHSIVWLTWKATERPFEFTQQAVSTYDEEMHMLIPDIVGALAVISALDKDRRMYNTLAPLVSEFFVLDYKLAQTTPSILDSSNQQAHEIAEIHGSAWSLNRRLEKEVTAMFVEISQPKSS